MNSPDSPEHADTVRQTIRENLRQIQSRVQAACEKSGREASGIRLIAVTKYTPEAIVAELEGLGHFDLGENRPQQLIERAEHLSNKFRWHLIGQLQRNKVRAVLPYVEMVHSVDSEKLLKHIDRIAGELNLSPKVLLQVNTSGEEAKSGFTPEAIKKEWGSLSSVEHIEINGLMTMAPHTTDEGVLRKTFSRLRHLRDELAANSNGHNLTELSMGMSNDFEIAIEVGATLIRLGTSVFRGCDV